MMNKKDLSSVVAANVKSLMTTHGLKQSALASRAGVSQKTISNLLSSQEDEGRPKSATLDTVEKVAAALKVDSWRLLMDLTPDQRKAWDSIEAAFNALQTSNTRPQLAVTTVKPNGSTGQ